MRTGSSDIGFEGHRSRIHRDARLKKARKSRYRWIDLEGLEFRTLLATIPAVTATGAPVQLTNLSNVTTDGDANSPAVAVDPYDSQKVFAVWGLDLSQITPEPTPTTAIVEGAYSSDGGTNWNGIDVSDPILDAATIDSTPPTPYTQVTSPSVGFDSQGNVYVLTLQTSGPADGALTLSKFNFSGATPQVDFENQVIERWLSTSDAVNSPVLAVDAGTYPNSSPGGTPPPGVPQDNFANNVYIAWASTDIEPVNHDPYLGPGYNPNRAELLVSSDGGNSFSGETIASVGGNFGPRDDSHPQLVINSNDSGQVTVAWDDFGTGATASPPFDELMSNIIQEGDSYEFTNPGGAIDPGLAGASGAPDIPVTTDFPVQVNINNPAQVLGLTVSVGMIHPTVGDVSIVLQAPNDGPSITLLLNATDAAGNQTGNGLAGANLGIYGESTTNPGIYIGTVFDDNATRDIYDPTTTGTNGNAAPAVGHYRPERGSLDAFVSSLPASDFTNSTWTLKITDFRTETTPGVLTNLSLQFTTGMSRGTPSLIATTFVPGAIANTFPTAVPSTPNGVGPGLVLAIDNTLGPDSPFKGRIYAAYVGYYDVIIDGLQNPTTNTDIFLAYSDNGGRTWVFDGQVNDDDALADGFSASSESSIANTNNEPVLGDQYTGRTQFQPEIAVDQSTGTLVISWRDARNDAANARVATYITTSIDGGASFSAQTYANPSETAIDAITGQTDVLGPLADNESGGNAQRDAPFGYGDQMGLAVADGQVFPVWAGNFNQSFISAGTVTAFPLNIWYRPMVIAAGPSITSSTMGPIPYAEAAAPGHQVSISVTFDRPIDPATVLAGDVRVFFHDTSNLDSSISLPVISFLPTGGGTSPTTQFTIIFDAALAGTTIDPATGLAADYTGTYSYLIAPDAGPSTPAISAPIWSYVDGVFRPGDPMDQNADGTVDENAVTTAFVGTTPGDVYAVPMPQPGAAITFSGAASILTPPFDQNTEPLIVPGPQVLSTSVPGGTGSDNLITNGTTSSLNVTFDRPINTSSFTPSQVVSIMGPTGAITGPQYFPSDVQTGQTISGTLDSTLTIPSFDGTFKIADITVSLTAAFSSDSDLTAVLIAPNGMQVPLFTGVGGSGADFINTVLDDAGETSITTGAAPFTGTFKPTGMLSDLDGLPVDFKNASGLWVPGVWTLQLTTSTTGVTGTLDNWSLSITPQISVTGLTPGTFTGTLTTNSATVTGITSTALLVAGESITGTGIPSGTTIQAINSLTSITLSADATHTGSESLATLISTTVPTTQFRIGFPLQQLSGTYTIQFGPNILDTFGDALDINQNAGLDVLRDQSQNAPTTTIDYTAADLPKAIPAPVSSSPATVSSSITVPDSFVIQGDKTAAGASVMQVQLSLTYPNDPDLTATLYHYDLSGKQLMGQVTLFSGVGQGINTANFDNTVFDDNSPTPIQNGSAPFFATYDPQESLATVFAPAPSGMNVQGIWTLVISNASTTGGTGTFTGWSLSFQKPLPTTGLGEPGTDIATASFRIFTLGQSDALSSEAWTSIGAAATSSTNGGGGAGEVSAIAVDPSDPSGNTVYAAGASGGIWKTTDFLTTSSNGPTWIPLTNFGPSSGINIGAITVFARNNNPQDSIIIAATGSATSGEGNTTAPGVGFLISEDGGATWNLDDSIDNVDSSGNILPINSPSRDREFVGTTAYAVTVDPQLTPNGQVIIYAALSGTNGGIWRSEDTGQTWVQLLAGNATSVVLDPNSGTVLNPTTSTNEQGNLQIVYAGFAAPTGTAGAAAGVYLSPNQGQVWNLMAGGIGNPLIIDDTTGANTDPATNPTPNGAGGRVVLAVPDPNGNAVEDAIYSGWLYAAVSTPTGGFDGLFLTKDFGENWTNVGLNTALPATNVLSPVTQSPIGFNQGIPSNDVTNPAYPITDVSQGNIALSLIVDPTDPSIVYLGSFGGDAYNSDTGLIRVNTTNLWDAHSLVAFYSFANDGGTLNLNSIGPAGVNFNNPPVVFPAQSYLNYIRSPLAPFEVDATLRVANYANFTNNGAGATWTAFDMPGTGYQTAVALTDPTTGLPRLIFGSDTGIWSVLDDNGSFETTIGGFDSTPGINRNGNLQLTQFYYGAAQPSTAAAEAAGALFYGGAQNTGAPSSSANILTTGDLQWSIPGQLQSGAGVATDQQGSGTLFQYLLPYEGGNYAYTNFFQVNGTGRTFGLFQASGGQPTPDPQWEPLGVANFALNPVNDNDAVISSSVGRIFSTDDQGETWFDIGDPAIFGSPTGYSLALAYGAPDPSAPEGVGNLGNFIYVGTQAGQVYVTQDGGGSGTSNNWINISTGISGAVQMFATDPARGSHDLYAVTTTGVFYMADSIPSTTNPTPTWVNITGNLQTLAYSIFGQSYNPANDTQPYDLATALTSIVADWRYAIPNNPADPSQGTHPVLYVGANSGVYQSLDNGTTWTFFPDTTYGAVTEGGDLPHVNVTDLSLSLGNIDANTGMPVLAGPYNPADPGQPADPDLLMATSYGEGAFAINLAPLIVGNAVTVSPTTPGTGSSTVPVVTGPVTISGSSEITATGNATWITIEDVTNPADPKIIGGFNPANAISAPNSSDATDAEGNFAISFNPATAYTSNGVKTIEIFATDDAGSVGNKVTYTFTLDDSNLPPPIPTGPPVFSSPLQLLPADVKGQIGNPPVPVTNLENPEFIGTTDPGVTITVFETQQVNGSFGAPTQVNPASLQISSNGSFSFLFQNPLTGTSPIPSGTFQVYVVAAFTSDPSLHTQSTTVTFEIDNTTPAAATNFRLDPGDDTGIVGDDITSDRTPYFIGTATAGDEVELFQSANFVGVVTSGSASVTGITSTTGLLAGEAVSGTGIPSGTTIKSVNSSTTITLSAPATANSQSFTALVPMFSSPAPIASSASGTDSKGQSYNFALQLPFVLTDGSITLEVVVVNPFSGNASPASTPVTVTIVSVASDYNGDGLSDPALFTRNTASNLMLWFVQPSGSSPIWFTSGMAFPIATQFPTASGLPTANGVPFQGDFDSDGKTDLAFYDPATATWFLDQSTQGLTSFVLGTPNTMVYQPGVNVSVPVVGNFEPNGPTDAAYFNNGVWTITSAFSGNVTKMFGQAGDIPEPGDYDGVGYDELAVYRPSNGEFLVLNPVTNQTETFNLGVGGSSDLSSLVPVPGAYDNQQYFNSGLAERTEAAVYDPITGVFTILYVGTQTGPTYGPSGVYTVSGFQKGDIPAPADYTGNGSTQAVVFRPTTGQFIGAGGAIIATLGHTGDIPLAAPLVYRLPAIDPSDSSDPPESGSTGTGTTGTGTGTTGTGTSGAGTGTTGIGTTGTGSGVAAGSGQSATGTTGTGATGTGSTSSSSPPAQSPPASPSHKKTAKAKHEPKAKPKPKPVPKPSSHKKTHLKAKKTEHHAPKPKVRVVHHAAVKVVSASSSAVKPATHVVDLALEDIHVNLRRSLSGKRKDG